MKNCPLCEKEVYSEITKGCKLCGMPLENINDDFCSDNCETMYTNIQKVTA